MDLVDRVEVGMVATEAAEEEAEEEASEPLQDGEQSSSRISA